MITIIMGLVHRNEFVVITWNHQMPVEHVDMVINTYEIPVC